MSVVAPPLRRGERRSVWSKLWNALVTALAWLYPLSLLGATAVLACVGERWWVTGLWLYLPRLPFAAPLPIICLALLVSRRWRLLWTQAAAVFVLLFVWMGLALPRPNFNHRNAPGLRLLSYNINSAFGGVDKIVEEIDHYSPDVVLLQEIGETEDLSELLERSYANIHISGQFLLATRYPVLETVDPDKLEYRGHLRSPRFLKQVLDTPLGRVVIYNVHPLSPRDVFNKLRGNGLRREILSMRLFSPASATTFRANSDLRALQVETIAESAQQETDPVIIAGDTNLPGLSFVLHHNLSAYQDGFASAGRGFGYTFPTYRRAWMRIDRILASHELRFVRFETGTSLASDHYCVVAELSKNSS